MTGATTPTKRGPYARTRQRREQISLAVLELVDGVGHESVTTALVAQRCATPEATVLYHFPSRDHLLVAALEAADDLEIELSQGEGEDAWLDPEELRQATNATLMQNEPRLRLYLVMRGLAATPDHPAAAYFTQRTRRSVDIFSALITRRQAAGLAHPGLDPRAVALQFIALWDGITAVWVNDRSVDVGETLYHALRRLSGENFMAARALLEDPDVGM